MRFLADENFPADAVVALRASGEDVVAVADVAPGSADADILAWAAREARILVTFDKDFGELAWRAGLPAACGVVLFRLPMPKPADAGRVLAAVLTGRSDWAGQFAVIEPQRVRMRRLPGDSDAGRRPPE